MKIRQEGYDCVHMVFHLRRGEIDFHSVACGKNDQLSVGYPISQIQKGPWQSFVMKGDLLPYFYRSRFMI
jgi:hypothetical protein